MVGTVGRKERVEKARTIVMERIATLVAKRSQRAKTAESCFRKAPQVSNRMNPSEKASQISLISNVFAVVLRGTLQRTVGRRSAMFRMVIKWKE